MITKSGYATKKSNVTQEKVNSYRQLLNEPAQEATSTPVVQEQVKPVNIRDLSVSNVLPKPKVNISADQVKPLNMRNFVNEINSTPEAKRANLTVQTDSLKKQINTKEQEYARANNISDWNTKREEQNRIQQELNALRKQLDSKNQDLVMLGGYNLISGEQVEQFNKNAPLTQKIDKALKYDIPTTAKKVGRTAMDLAMQIPTAVYDVYEGALDATVANVGALGSTIADKTGNQDIANKIREEATKFVNITPSSKTYVEEAKNKGEGIYEPELLGIKVRDALYSISNIITAARSGGLPMMALSASGQNIEEALTDNQSLERAVLYGDISGAIEGLTEKMFDAVKIVGGGKFDKFLPKSAIGKLIGGSAGEGLEEIIANGLNPFIKQLTYEKGTYDLPDFYEYIKMLGESFWNGAVIGAIMKGGQDISTPQFREQYKQDVYTAVDKSKLPDNIKETVKQAMITPAQQAINQDLESLRSTGAYQRTQTPTNTLPKFSEITGKKIADTQIEKTSQPALPAPKFYATEKGEVITPNSYVAKQETKVPEQPNYSPVNSRQVLAKNEGESLQQVTEVDSLENKEYNNNMRNDEKVTDAKPTTEEITEKIPKKTPEKPTIVQTTTEKTTKKYISPITNTKEATDFVKNSTIDDIETLKEMAKEVGQKPTRVDLQFFAEELKKKIEGLEYAKTIKGKRLSKYAQTLANAGVTTAETQDMITKMVEEGSLTHEVIKDKTAKAYAENYIKENGFKDAVAHWNQIIKGGRELSKNDLALGMTIFNEANTNKDTTLTKKMIVDLVTEGTHLGRGLQALSMINKLTPDGRLYSLERTAQKLNQELRDKIGKDYKDIEIPDDLADKLLNSQTEAETDAVVEEIQQYIADQVPATWEDKLNSWRYLSMLGNPRTHIRNIFGNAVFIPAVEMKNLIAMQGEKLLPQELRTKSVLTKKDADLLNFAADDFNSNQQAIRGENKYDIKAGVQEKRTIYNNKFLETLRKKNFELLEKEDATFLKFHYKRAMARAIKAKGLTLEDIRSGKPETTKALNEIRNYAINEAQKATYRDANAVASWISAQKRRLSKAGSASKLAKVGSMAVEGVVPFAKTPANILKRGIEYSPIGLIKGVYDVTKGVKSEKITATQAIDELAAGLTGTGIMMLGVLLKSLGLITGGDKEKEKEQNFNELKGYQNYALKIGNKTYTIDWMAPASMPLFVGVELLDLIQNKETADIIKSLGNITDPVFELSMLQGINSIMNTLGESNPIGATLSRTFQSYLGQYNPTLLGQLARTIDPVRRTTYTNKDSILPSGVQYFLQRQIQKIPFATKALPTYKDEFGREDVTENVVERIFSNFLSPGYLEDVKGSAVENELSKLYEDTGETAILPTSATKQITVNKEKINLNSKQYDKFAKVRGNVAYQNLEKLVTSKEYKSMEDADKVTAVKNIYEYANAIGKAEVSDYKLTKSEQLIKTYEEAGIDYYKWLILKEKADTDGNDYISKDEMDKTLNKSGLTNKQKKLIRTTFNKK